MIKDKKKFIAEMLREAQLITDHQLQIAMNEQKISDKKIGQILIEKGFLEENVLLTFLSKQFNIPYIDLKNYPFQPNLIKLLPELYARHFRVIILNQDERGFLVGMVDPQDILAHDEIERILHQKIHLALIREEDLLPVLDNFYRRTKEISELAETLSAELKPTEVSHSLEENAFSAEDAPVVKLLKSIFEDAIQVNASDIHIEPDENILRIRLRVDGMLQEFIVKEKNIEQALVQRIKIMAGLNIAEKRLPQDGRFSVTIKSKHLDVRVSCLPVQYGESVVMRLLNQSADLINLSHIGMPEKLLNYFKQVLSFTYGLFLIVGPTGSGKTTTLYGALNYLNQPEKKIITVEDPIEYRLPRINQVQVKSQIGLNFAGALRAILRQDPNIIMIGELRDQETVEIAIRAAMTGHFVLATLHTQDTLSAPIRLLDMGTQAYLLAGVLRAILAQRLVRRICPYCKEEDKLSPLQKNWLSAIHQENYLNISFKKGKGCSSCRNTGYQGRIGLFELLPFSETSANALRLNDIEKFRARAIQQPIYLSLLETALELAKEGVTSIHEVIRMAGEI